MQFVASLVPSLFKPADTLPQWTAWLVVGFTVWFFHFVCTRKPDAIRQEEARRRKNILDMMQAVVAYVDAEDAKPEDTRKLPELCRVRDLLWDKTHDCRTTVWGIEPESELHRRCEALYKRVALHEITRATELTRRARMG